MIFRRLIYNNFVCVFILGSFLLPRSLDYSKQVYHIENLPYNLPLELIGVGKNIEVWKGMNDSKLLLSHIAAAQVFQTKFDSNIFYPSNISNSTAVIQSLLED